MSDFFGDIAPVSYNPHAEGLADPQDFFDLLPDTLPQADVRRIMRDNSRALFGLD